ncbi:hypothetical protein TNCV_4535121 [Trichonephila clavipes]|nr:hypothetical protein TNCV_4535121 [Trichonephila clavipes]
MSTEGAVGSHQCFEKQPKEAKNELKEKGQEETKQEILKGLKETKNELKERMQKSRRILQRDEDLKKKLLACGKTTNEAAEVLQTLPNTERLNLNSLYNALDLRFGQKYSKDYASTS